MILSGEWRDNIIFNSYTWCFYMCLSIFIMIACQKSSLKIETFVDLHIIQLTLMKSGFCLVDGPHVMTIQSNASFCILLDYLMRYVFVHVACSCRLSFCFSAQT